jgi:hypothetical protein
MALAYDERAEQATLEAWSQGLEDGNAEHAASKEQRQEAEKKKREEEAKKAKGPEAGQEQKAGAEKAEEKTTDPPMTQEEDPAKLVCRDPDPAPQGDVTVYVIYNYMFEDPNTTQDMDGDGVSSEPGPPPPIPPPPEHLETAFLGIGASLFGFDEGIGGTMSFGIYVNNDGGFGIYTSSGGGNGREVGIGMCVGNWLGRMDGPSDFSEATIGGTYTTYTNGNQHVGQTFCAGKGLFLGAAEGNGTTTQYPIIGNQHWW